MKNIKIVFGITILINMMAVLFLLYTIAIHTNKTYKQTKRIADDNAKYYAWDTEEYYSLSK